MKAVNYVLYDKSGRIVQTGSSPETMADLHKLGPHGYAEGVADLERDYVKDGAIAPRPAGHAELAGKTLIGLPVPCVVHINQTGYSCSEPVAELSFPYPGTYRIRIEAFPYLDALFFLEQS